MTYCYKCFTCNTVTERVSMVEGRKAWVRCSKCGRRAVRDLQGEHGQHRDTPGNYPRLSEAVGCHPKQVAAYSKIAKEKGVPTEITKGGFVKFRDKTHERKFCQALGYYQRNAGFSDATPQGGIK